MTRHINAIFTFILLVVFSSHLHAETAAEVAIKTQSAIASGTAPEWMSPNVPEDILPKLQNHCKELAQSLNLDSAANQAKVESLLIEHYTRLWAWHQLVDEKLDTAWADWDKARDPSQDGKDELKALTIMTERIDPIYAEFAPQVQYLLDSLHKVLSEEQVIALLDRITRSPGVDRTYNAYVEMVPEMTDPEKKILKSRLEQARIDSLAARDKKRIIKIFKKYKIRNEFSIDYFGYGYREHYTAWVNRGKSK